MSDQRWSHPHPSYSSASSTPPTPFTLCQITGNISVCVGCRNKYNKNNDDMCIRHQEWCEYTPPGQAVSHRFANVYYHFSVQCVWLRCPWFIPTQLEVPPEIMTSLGTAHKSKLTKEFGIVLD